jgi:hypothetical protein
MPLLRLCLWKLHLRLDFSTTLCNLYFGPTCHFVKSLPCNLSRYCIYSPYYCYTCDLNIMNTCIDASILSSQNQGVTSPSSTAHLEFFWGLISMQVQPSAKVEAHHTRMDYSCLYKKDFMFTEQSLILTCNIPSFTQIMFSSNFLTEESIGGKNCRSL